MTETLRFTLTLAAAVLVSLSVAACGDAPTAIPPPTAASPLTRQASAVPAQPVRLQFEKCIVDPVNGIWEGQVTGDIEGDLRTELRELRATETETSGMSASTGSSRPGSSRSWPTSAGS